MNGLISLRWRPCPYKGLIFISIFLLAFGLLAATSFVFPWTARADELWVTNTDDSGEGSLRQAIIDANDNPGTDTIGFNITGDPPYTVEPLSALPELTDDGTIIDGYTQTGASTGALGSGNRNIVVEISNINTAGSHGVQINGASDCVIRGLAINNCNRCVYITGAGASHNTIEGNYLGTDTTGTSAGGTPQGGVLIYDGPGESTVGDEEGTQGNLISGIGGCGVQIDSPSEGGSSCEDNLIAGNWIGLSSTGSALPNESSGIRIGGGCPGTVIGGSTTGANVISNNTRHGVSLESSTGCEVSYNTITDNGNDATIHDYYATVAPLSYGGTDYDTAFRPGLIGDGFLWINDNPPALVLVDDTTVPFLDGETNINVALGAAFGGMNMTLYVHPFWTEEMLTAHLGMTVDLYQEDAFLAQGKGVDYLWNCEAPGVALVDNTNYKASASPLTYRGTNYDDMFADEGEVTGMRGSMFLGDVVDEGEFAQVPYDGVAVPFADGTNNFNVCLFHDTDYDLHNTLYLRNDIFPDPDSFVTLFEMMGGHGVADHWEDDVLVAHGAGNAYTWESSASVIPGGWTYPPWLEVKPYTDPPTLTAGSERYQWAGVNLNDASDITIECNTIDSNGNGIAARDSYNNTILNNQIRTNPGTGVVLWDRFSVNNEVSRNSFYGDGRLAIDLGGNGVNTNDGYNDNGTKPNRGYNYPVFSRDHFPVDASGNVFVNGTAPPGATVELYWTGANADPSGHGQGLVFKKEVTADSEGSFSTTLSGMAAGRHISAIAISPSGNTSEFGANAELRNPARVSALMNVTGADNGVVRPGGTIGYGISLANTGSSDLPDNPGPELIDDIPDNTNYVNGSAAATTGTVAYNESENRVEWNGALPPGAGVEISFDVTVDEGLASGTVVENQARIYWDANGDGENETMTLSGLPGNPDGEEPAVVVVQDILGSTTWYLAEGATGGGFDTYIEVANPNGEATEATATFITDTGTAGTHDFTVPARSRYTMHLNQLVPDNFQVATEIASQDPVVVERSTYWDSRDEDQPYLMMGGNSNGASAAAHRMDYSANGGEEKSVCYYPEGATAGGFDTYILLFNPSETDAEVQLTYMTGTGATSSEEVEVPARRRRTVHLNEAVESEFDVATRVASNVPIVTERSMYWSTSDGSAPYEMRGGHSNTGPSTLSGSWYVAEGSTGGGFSSWILLQNPGDEDALVDVTFNSTDGVKTEAEMTLEAGSRQTIDVSEYVPDDYNVSAEISSSAPIAAERSMYWNGNEVAEPYLMKDGNCATALTDTGTRWLVAEGCTGGTFDTWLLVQNPGEVEADVTVSFLTLGGEAGRVDLALPPKSRRSVRVKDTLPDEFQVSALVQSSAPVTVERSTYFDTSEGTAPDECEGGHSTVGVGAR